MTAILAALALIILPPTERAVVRETARAYALTNEQTALLAAIRRAENGRAALAWGVADPRCRTYRKQCAWCANTIRLRYRGDIRAFAARWCPTDARNWERNVRFFMTKQGFKK